MTTMVDATYAQQVFQGFADDAAPATATAISAATNTNFTRRASTKWQLRFRIAQTTANANQNNVKAFKLKVQVNGTGGFADVAAQGATGVKVRYADSANFADGDGIATGDFRLGTGTGTAVAGECNEAANTDSITFPVAGSASYTELVFALEWGPDVAHLDTFEFRVYESDDTALGTYTVTPVVRHNGTGAAIEVVRTLIPAGGGDYTLLSSWESGEQSDLVAADEVAAVECQSGSISDNVLVTGWTTDATRYPHMRNASGHEHGGLASAGFKITTSSSITLDLDQGYTRASGIVIEQTGTTNSGADIGAAGVHVNGCVITSPTPAGSGFTHDGIRDINTGDAHAYNNIIYGFRYGFATAVGATGNFNVYNNTIVDCTNGIARFTKTLRPKNNIVQGGTTNYQGTLTDSATNISSDATSPQVGLRNITLTFVNAAGDNYHLASGDTEAIGAGTDLSADANLAFSTDIDDDARPAGAWDIGADEFIAAGGETLTAEAGAFTLTGQAASLEWNHVLAADGGTYSLSGAAAATEWNHLLAADGGAYTLTGEAATLIRHVPLTAEGGAYTLTGTDATLVWNQEGAVLAAEAGSFTLSGTAAATQWNHTLAADGGAYSLSGADAALFQGFFLNAEAGSFALSGVDAATRWNHTLTADGGSYSLTGQDATLARHVPLSAEAGAFSLSGQAATLVWNKGLLAEAGTFALTGLAADLVPPGGIPDQPHLRMQFYPGLFRRRGHP